MLSKGEYKIVSEYLISKIDFDKVYNECAPISKEKFSKESIINSVKRMIRDYPTFDTSMKGRTESFTLVLSARRGTFNDYIYFVSGRNADDSSWWITEEKFQSRIKNYKQMNRNYVCFNMKDYLRSYKVKQLIENVK